MKDGDGLGLAVAAVLAAGCCLALPLLVALAAGAAVYLVAGLAAGVVALAGAVVVVARVRRRRPAVGERPARARAGGAPSTTLAVTEVGVEAYAV